MRAFFHRPYPPILGLALLAMAAALPAAADDLFVPPGMLKGKPIAPDGRPEGPVLFVFACIEPDKDAQKQVQPVLRKLDEAHAKITKAGLRVVVVGSGVGTEDTIRFVRQSQITRLDVLCDPLGLMNAQCEAGVSKNNPLVMVSWEPDGTRTRVADADSFLSSQAAPKSTGTAVPWVELPADPDRRLAGKYDLLRKGRPAMALAQFRRAAGDRGPDAKPAAEARAMADAIEKKLDGMLATFRTNTADHWVDDYETAQKMAKDWKDDPRSREKIEKFAKQWGEKKDIRDELAARKMRLQLWSAMRRETAPGPHHPLLNGGFEKLAKAYPDCPTGRQAATLLRWIPQ